MILTCLFGTNNIQIVEVKKTDPICSLKKKLGISYIGLKFIFNRATYMVDTNLKFEDIGLTHDAQLNFNSAAISG